MTHTVIGRWAVLCLATTSALAADAPELTFEKQVRPILKAHCFQCHGEAGKTEAKLDVRLKRLLEKGGETGPAIVPGQPEQSLLLKRIESGEMPPVERKLTPAERDVLRRWIAGGAKTAAAEPEKPDESVFTAEERNHWAFQPIIQWSYIPLPRPDGSRRPGEGSVDSMLLSKLEVKQLSFATEADRRTLIRRATFDLLGLPPTPDEIEEFVNDSEPDAYERLIDRLLASPRYG